MAWLETYAYRRKITIDNTNIDSDLTHFPVPIVLGTSVGQSSQDVSDIFDEVGASYLKIAITKVDGTTQIYGDVEQWDNVNEKAVIHVAKSDLAITTAATTDIYIYYDSAQGDNTTYISLSGGTAAQSVWDSNFKAIYHMSQDPSGGAGCILDSTSNDNNGTPYGMIASGDLVDGLIGKALDFDGTDDYIDCGSGASIDDISVKTIEAIINMDSFGESTSGRIAQKANSNADGWQFLVQGGGVTADRLYFGQDWNGGTFASWVTDTETLTISTWLSVAVSYDKGTTANNPLMYIDGVVKNVTEIATPTGSCDSDAANSMWIGARNNSGVDREFDGKISELRISDITRSADWIKATNYALTDDLITFGVIEINVAHPETNVVSSIDSIIQIDILAQELSIPITVTNPTIFTGVFVSTPEITIPATADCDININITSNEIFIPATVTSNISIDLVPAEAISEIVIPEPNLFVGLFIESPEITIPATADSNIIIIIVPIETTIIPIVTSPIFNINIASSEVTIPLDSSGSTITTFSMASTVTRYLLTITGSADSLEDFALPMSSFQARRKSGEATYLSVVIPTMDYADEIAERSNGTIKVEQAYTLNDEYVQRELIIEAEIDNIQTYQGGMNQSVVLEGYKTTTYVPKSMTLTTSTYRSLSGGKLRYRVAKPNVFLNPGDTVTIGDDTFIIGTMAYAISPTMQQIELEEA